MDNLISIIVPAYNVAAYINRCVESLVTQSYNKIEIILVDDGSTDETGALCDDWRNQDGRIKVIHQSNTGQSGARNRGINIAAGEYFCFVDSDDWVEKDYIESMYHVLQLHHADIVICDYTTKEDTSVPNGCLDDSVYVPYLLNHRDAYEILADVCNQQAVSMVSPCNKLYSKNIFKEIRYTEGILHEDEFIIHHIINTAKTIVILPKTLYHYCERAGSTTRDEKYYNKRHLDVLKAYHDRTEFYRTHCSIELYRKMILAYCEMVTIQYHTASGKMQKNKDEKEIYHYVNQYMKMVLSAYGNQMTLRKKLKYFLFIICKKAYFKYFWHE